MIKKIILLGATGSIGTSTLSVVESFSDRLSIVAASAHTNLDALLEIGAKFTIPQLSLSGASSRSSNIAFTGQDGLLEMIRTIDADIVVNGIAGAMGLMPSVAALESGKDLALANKETLVMAGTLIRSLAAKQQQRLIPVDSEHSALFSLKERLKDEEVQELVLTASGGAFRSRTIEELDAVTWQDALAHPTWDMGVKITIDSASMANKGLEVIEACELFDVPEERVRVVIHPQSCVHGMVTTTDGSIYAQMSLPDMRSPIQNALSYPDILPYPFQHLSFEDLTLNFDVPDPTRYPCLSLARDAARSGGAYPLVYNAANEVAVQGFIENAIQFTDIPVVLSDCLDEDWPNLVRSFDQVLELDLAARSRAEQTLLQMARHS